MPSLSERIAANVRRYREEATKCPKCGTVHTRWAVSQGQLAEAAGITRAALNEIESEKREPTTATLEKLAKALMCKVQDLMD